MTTKETTGATMHSLEAVDAAIRATTGGEAGTGLYTLLDLLAGQFMGVPRSAMPAAAPPAQTLSAPIPTVQPGSPTGEGEDKPLGPTRAELGGMTKEELLGVAEDEEVEVDHTSTKADIIDAIVKHRHRPGRR